MTCLIIDTAFMFDTMIVLLNELYQLMSTTQTQVTVALLSEVR